MANRRRMDFASRRCDDLLSRAKRRAPISTQTGKPAAFDLLGQECSGHRGWNRGCRRAGRQSDFHAIERSAKYGRGSWPDRSNATERERYFENYLGLLGAACDGAARVRSASYSSGNRSGGGPSEPHPLADCFDGTADSCAYGSLCPGNDGSPWGGEGG